VLAVAANRVLPDADAQLFTADALAGLEQHVDDGSIRLIITSPPYNIGKPYEQKHKLSLDNYIEWLKPIELDLRARSGSTRTQGDTAALSSLKLTTMYKKIATNGSMCWLTGNFVLNSEVFPLDVLLYQLFTYLGFKLRNRVIWRVNFGLHATKRLSGR
jgi:adenine-specific DNA-methyltransferase